MPEDRTPDTGPTPRPNAITAQPASKDLRLNFPTI